MKAPKKISLDEIMSKRAFSVHKTQGGNEALFKITKAPATWNEESRSAEFVMSTQAVDRYGDVVETKGIDIDEFNKNPVVLFAHNSRGYPIGQWSGVKKLTATRPPRLEGVCNFAPEDTVEEADTAAKLVSAGIMRACSIGFMPKDWEIIRDDDGFWIGVRFVESELLECSVCAVPAHPHALVKSAGGDEGMALQAIELVLDEWAKTPDGLIVPREKYERAYKTVKNKDASVHEVRAVDEEDGDDEMAKSIGTITVKLENDPDFLERIKKTIADVVAKALGSSESADEQSEEIDEDDPETKQVEEGDPPLEHDAELERQIEDEENLADEQEMLEARARAMALLDEEEGQ